jgi:hypothetical protein
MKRAFSHALSQAFAHWLHPGKGVGRSFGHSDALAFARFVTPPGASLTARRASAARLTARREEKRLYVRHTVQRNLP